MQRRSGWAEPVARIDDAEAFDAAYKPVLTRDEHKTVVGTGASGRVLLYEHRQTKVKCVLKQIPMMSMKDAGPVMKEVTVLSQLEHPHITRYHGSWHAEGYLNILMEYADGGTLARSLSGRLEEKQFLDEDVLMDWFVQVTLAVHYIHERNILHRDLKAQNVLLTKRGLIKVCDFGIAKVLDETSGGSLRGANTCIGTPLYLSPEIVEGKTYGLPTDMWSLGVLLYEMAALKKPFVADSLPALAMQIIRNSYEPLPKCYSAELHALVASLLQKKPEDRPTVVQLIEDSFFVENFERLEAELADLASGQGFALARASILSPPAAYRQSVLSPTTNSSTTNGYDATLVWSGAGPLPTAPLATAADTQHEQRAGEWAEHERPSQLDTTTPSDPLSRVAGAHTVGRTGGLSAVREVGGAPQLPARGASLPGMPAHGATSPSGRESGTLGRGGVGQLLHAAVGSPTAERAIACALRHELVLETSEKSKLTLSRLRASLEDNIRFSLNMQALESNLAAALDSGADEDATPECAHGRGAFAPRARAVADFGVQQQPGPAARTGPEPGAGAGGSAPLTAPPSESAAEPMAEEGGDRRAPFSINNTGFVTTRRTHRGGRQKARPAVSLETFAPPAPSGSTER
ncbi:kinase-like domain-containing protein [Pavlovales sp. CCMP2436]|nr:kinase-like domain-containing protein [Pavlovales sp. CCMP2436]